MMQREECQWDVKFGWHLILALVDAKKPLDPNIHEDFLRQAYRVENDGCRDPVIIGALALRHPMRKLIADGLEALLLTDMSLEDISESTGRPLDVIRVYEQLFFNVRDRREDYQFIANHLYPEGKLIEMAKDYHLHEDPGMIVKRAGWKGNIDDVKILLSLMPEKQTDFNLAQDRTNFESRIMYEANNQARFGFINQQTRIQRDAKNLLASSKIAGEDQAKGADQSGLTASLGEAMLADIMRIADSAAKQVPVPPAPIDV